MALVILSIAAPVHSPGPAASEDLLGLAVIGILVSVGVTYVHSVVRWVQRGSHRSGSVRDYPGFGTLRGVIGLFVAGCEAMALLAIALRL
jgi:hypothetical protein